MPLRTVATYAILGTSTDTFYQIPGTSASKAPLARCNICNASATASSTHEMDDPWMSHARFDEQRHFGLNCAILLINLHKQDIQISHQTRLENTYRVPNENAKIA